MSFSKKSTLLLILVAGLCLDLCLGSGECKSAAHQDHDHHHHHHHDQHQCSHGHAHGDNHHHHDHDHGKKAAAERKLPEELAEEEDLRLCGFGPCPDHIHDFDHQSESNLQGLGLWSRALGCSLLVSLASLVCLILLPVIFIQGKPSKTFVDSLALFGAGAMLGDAFLHQLPHAFGGGHSHSNDQHGDHAHHDHFHSHSHSLKDLSVGLSVLAGILLFLLVEKLVRYVEEHSTGSDSWAHGHHHHHHHKSVKKGENENGITEKQLSSSSSNEKELSDGLSDASNADGHVQHKSPLRKRKSKAGGAADNLDVAATTPSEYVETTGKTKPVQTQSKLVFGYLNLFSDGVHNFTDGMALGSAFLLHGSVGGWSRTLFLLAHELPQEIGDFGILVRSGFTVSKALFFNFLSALVALAGTTMALLMGKDPGQSSLIEGFTAGGFIYIAVAGVLAEMNNTGKSTLRNTAGQLTSLMLGMGVALCISLVE